MRIGPAGGPEPPLDLFYHRISFRSRRACYAVAVAVLVSQAEESGQERDKKDKTPLPVVGDSPGRDRRQGIAKRSQPIARLSGCAAAPSPRAASFAGWPYNFKGRPTHRPTLSLPSPSKFVLRSRLHFPNTAPAPPFPATSSLQ